MLNREFFYIRIYIDEKRFQAVGWKLRAGLPPRAAGFQRNKSEKLVLIKYTCFLNIIKVLN